MGRAFFTVPGFGIAVIVMMAIRLFGAVAAGGVAGVARLPTFVAPPPTFVARLPTFRAPPSAARQRRGGAKEAVPAQKWPYFAAGKGTF